MSVEHVQQGATYDFCFDISGDDESGFTATFNVMQYPGDTPAISRALTYSDNSFIGSLTSAETASLAVGQWFIHISADDSDEAIREPIKIYIDKGWV